MSKKQSAFVCPVCHDTTMDGHLKHWVRNQNGSVVCPTLLGIACGVCGDRSHTTKKCLQKKREDRALRRSMYLTVSDCGGVQESSSRKEDQVRKVEELKRITADNTIKTNKEISFMRVFYSS